MNTGIGPCEILSIIMKKHILCLIENIGPSGAERQITNLAVQLRKQGHDVEVAYYVKKEFYLPFLMEVTSAGITMSRLSSESS